MQFQYQYRQVYFKKLQFLAVTGVLSCRFFIFKSVLYCEPVKLFKHKNRWCVKVSYKNNPARFYNFDACLMLTFEVVPHVIEP